MESFKRTDLSTRVEAEGIEIRTKEAGGMTIGWGRLSKGVDLSPATKGLPDDLCPCPHWGYVIKGKLRMKMKDGSSDYEAGQAFYFGPGHAPEALEDTEYVDFSPTAEVEKVIAYLTRQG
ncbi:MAG: hypothetical protein MUO75_02090 [Actinobacteria bacterium]|jgi:hypothetical protein|nr:hypothetical protein [Actinomycetota bacterium]